ncbi:IscS subfamily cysteine desulfurase [Rhodothermaceae bacterium RA]|nr:IscS subfamily cysteine desulfurase [Rhodothermaceae bacterium RA]
MQRLLYFDYNATTPVDERVLERMVPYFTQHFGNPSSSAHPFGWVAAEAVRQAREEVAEMLGADPAEIYFTSGATEGINTAIKGVAEAYAGKGRHIVTAATEHKAVLDACRALERRGARVTYLPVDGLGRVDPEELEAALTDETILVSIMWANNETGVLQPIEALAERVRRRGILFMTDATQAVGKVPVSVEHVDLLVLSGHKVYAPKGVGALYVRRRNPRVRLVPLLDGGGQERGVRGGTLNTPGIVGLGAALALARAEQPAEAARLAAWRDRLEAALRDDLGDDLQVNGAGTERLPQTSSLTFRGIPAERLMMNLRDLALSTGSACASGSGMPSHVLTAMGRSPAEAEATIRLSMGRFTTGEDVDYAIRQFRAAVHAMPDYGL